MMINVEICKHLECRFLSQFEDVWRIGIYKNTMTYCCDLAGGRVTRKHVPEKCPCLLEQMAQNFRKEQLQKVDIQVCELHEGQGG